MNRKWYIITIAVVGLVIFLVTFSRGCRSKGARALGISLAVPTADIQLIRTRAGEAAYFIRQHDFEDGFCILADMHLHSGIRRMFVWDLKSDTIIRAFNVSHGCGSKVWSWDLTKNQPVFSNKDGSHCSSLGKYRIGERGYSQWGIHVKYALHGLDKSNDHAFSRAIVLHSWDEITDDEVYPDGTPEGWGCPAVSNASMRFLDSCLKKVDKPVLLWQFDGSN